MRRRSFAVIAGPCSVENEAQILEVAEGVKSRRSDYAGGRRF